MFVSIQLTAEGLERLNPIFFFSNSNEFREVLWQVNKTLK